MLKSKYKVHYGNGVSVGGGNAPGSQTGNIGRQSGLSGHVTYTTDSGTKISAGGSADKGKPTSGVLSVGIPLGGEKGKGE